MNFLRNSARKFVPALLLLPLFVAASPAETTTTKPAAIRIKNFGRINENYFRGAQPESRDYGALATLGVKTVIDLNADGPSEERGLVERAGMKFYRIPMTTSDRPSQFAVTQFLKLVNDPANQPVFVHCH